MDRTCKARWIVTRFRNLKRKQTREKHTRCSMIFNFTEAINSWHLPSHLCWANSMSILVTLLWCVPSFCAAFCLLIHSALRGARKTPITSKLHPTTMRAVEFCAASAPGASCTKPTTNTTAPSSNDPTTTCNELTFEENAEKNFDQYNILDFIVFKAFIAVIFKSIINEKILVNGISFTI